MTPEWIWLIFIFAFGACVGSFLNVVIYRLPRDLSVVSPPSSCPACGASIRFYDNIPLISWPVLRGRCRRCAAPISPRYVVVELAAAILFLGIYAWFFVWEYRRTGLAGTDSMQRFFVSNGWLIYLHVMVLAAAFLAASAIDLELWVIPLSLCWIVTGVGMLTSAIGPLVVHLREGALCSIFPMVLPKWSAAAAGSTIGLLFSLWALKKGWIQASYNLDQKGTQEGIKAENKEKQDIDEPEYDDRKEILKEVVFLLPVILGGLIGFLAMKHPGFVDPWNRFSQLPLLEGFLGSLTGYLAGCGVVWATRIFGTLLFGREAMGLGDVHLMGAAGAVIGPGWVVLAFFVAPFFGLLWALYQFLSKKSRQIPYGPFLSLAVLAVILFRDQIYAYLERFYGI